MSNRTSNTQQAFWVAFGSIISYGFILLTSMILSRYFDKGDYGTYKQVMYVYNSLLVVFTLGLPRAYPYFIPRVNISEARDIINKITYIFIVLGFLFSVLLFFASPLIAQFLKNPDLDYAIKLFSIVPLFMLPTMGVDGILSSFKKAHFIAIYKGLSSLFQLILVSIPVIFFGGTYESAIIGFTISSFIIFIIALYLKKYPVRHEKRVKTSIKYKEIFSFSIPLMYASFWGIIMNSADQFFISNYFGKETFAEFSNGWMDLPFVSMIVGATSVVLLPVFSKIINENEDARDEIRPIWNNVINKTTVLIYPLLLYTFVFSKEIMILLYGNNYAISGVFFKIILVKNLFNLIAFAPLILAMGATKYYTKIIAYGALVTVILQFIIVRLIRSPYSVAVVSVLCHIGVIYFFMRFISSYLKTPIYKLLPVRLMFNLITILLPILFILHYLFVTLFSVNLFFMLVSSFTLYIIIFFIISKRLDIDYISILKPILNRWT